ncbi:MAG TPA: RecQ family ATP-dependent DNA helicase [Thermoanaerobaculia bacterium]|nr:RecQ family ATP-dependent DNA helicase [Thermoanaerobaculia bacterium]
MSTLRDQALALLGDGREFREGQFEAIDAIVERRERLLVVQRTGWGKSSVYFIATRLLRDRGLGPTLIISPLLSLMRNQLAEAERTGLATERIDSTNRSAWHGVHERIRRNELDALLISPERLAAETFVQMLLALAGNFGMLVIDEAHCISDWGHDFRPDYRRILRIVRQLPRNIPVLATTATASARVMRDIEEQVGGGMRTIRGPLRRDSLGLFCAPEAPAAVRLAWLARTIPKLGGSGIVYVQTKRDARRVAGYFKQRDIRAESYSADSPERERLEAALLDNEISVLVATIALGMGFHKEDLGFVIHFQRPKSLIDYYQQVGRAGRGIEKAWGVMLAGHEDFEISQFFIESSRPDPELVDTVLDKLATAQNGLTIDELESEINSPRTRIESTLKLLAVESPAPVRLEGGRWLRTPVPLAIDWQRFDRLRSLRYAEQRRVKEYGESRQCLMSVLSRELDDPDTRNCGRCGFCIGHAIEFDLPVTLIESARSYLANAETFIRPRTAYPRALHRAEGPVIPERLQHLGGRTLCSWGDEPLGTLVREGKAAGHFDQRLIEESVRLIRAKWKPEPAPQWVTCIPSRRHPDLVPDLARRIAEKLDLPFVESLIKPNETPPQKSMLNSVQQARNALGAFRTLDGTVRQGHALVVDDLVDSGWTFAAAGMQLRQAGCEGVHVFALARANRRDESE